MKIEDLCQQVVRAMIHAGYTECCAWSRYRDFYSPMLSFYRSCGEDEFSLEMMVRYSEHSHTRMEEEKICEHRYYEIMAGIKGALNFMRRENSIGRHRPKNQSSYKPMRHLENRKTVKGYQELLDAIPHTI